MIVNPNTKKAIIVPKTARFYLKILKTAFNSWRKAAFIAVKSNYFERKDVINNRCGIPKKCLSLL